MLPLPPHCRSIRIRGRLPSGKSKSVAFIRTRTSARAAPPGRRDRRPSVRRHRWCRGVETAHQQYASRSRWRFVLYTEIRTVRCSASQNSGTSRKAVTPYVFHTLTGERLMLTGSAGSASSVMVLHDVLARRQRRREYGGSGRGLVFHSFLSLDVNARPGEVLSIERNRTQHLRELFHYLLERAADHGFEHG